MPLKEYLDELNFVMIELRDIDVKMEDEILVMILLASLPPSYENFVSSLSVGNDSVKGGRKSKVDPKDIFNYCKELS